MSKEQLLIQALSKPVKIFTSKTTDSIYAHREFKSLLEEACSYYSLSRSHLTFYISSEKINGVRTDVWYDTGGVSVPCFYGIMVIEAEPNSTINVGGVDLPLIVNSLYLWESGKKIRYSHEKTAMLGFNIVPKSMLKNQDPARWQEL